MAEDRIRAGSGVPKLGQLTELKQRILFLLGALVVYRIGAHIPVPGIDPAALQELFNQQRGSILDMFNMFSGGALSRFSIFTLGIMPYISASSIMQLMTVVSPTLEALPAEDRQKAVLWGRKALMEDPNCVEATDFLKQIGEI